MEKFSDKFKEKKSVKNLVKIFENFSLNCFFQVLAKNDDFQISAKKIRKIFWKNFQINFKKKNSVKNLAKISEKISDKVKEKNSVKNLVKISEKSTEKISEKISDM